MQHNKQLTISRANSRKSTTWPAQSILWNELVELFKTPVRGIETHEQYLKLPKGQQDDLKDVGSFVGGTLKANRRKAANVLKRYLVTLDLDNIPSGQTTEVLKRIEGLGCGYAVYSTRKHSAYKPRLRLIIPLAREVEADQYEPIARKLASLIGIEMADPTTFQAERLMYFPSCSCDSQYVYQVSDKPFVDGDGILGTYPDWRNVEEWPKVPGDETKYKKLVAKQGNPLDKKNIVGVFCRQYNIYETMEKFLPGIYELTDVEYRLTYLEGSTTGGAVIYGDGLWLYSHHATDPCSQTLVNAFDLVRLHRFHELDDEAKPDTPANKMPSYLAMVTLAKTDDQVAKALQAEAVERAKADFADKVATAADNVEVDTDHLDWFELIELHEKTHKPLVTPQNVIVLLEHDPVLKGRLKKDVFNNKINGIAPLPWSPRDKETGGFFWGDGDAAGLRNYISVALGFRVKDVVKDGYTEVYNRHQYHPVKDYLNSLVWDGVKRAETLFIDWLAAEDIPGYTRLATRQFLKAMIKRIFEPGCEYQEMVVLVGEQGIYKSNLFRELSKGWFLDSLDSTDTKMVGERTEGSWIVTLDELKLFKKLSEESKKEFISRRMEKYRPAYAEFTDEKYRSFVLTGTSNKMEFLGDFTGDRRYIPILCGDKETVMAKNPEQNFPLVVDQILAEALVLYKQDPFVGIPRENWTLFNEQRELFRYENEYMEDVRVILEQAKYPQRISLEWLAEKIIYLGSKPSREEKLRLQEAVQRLKRYKKIMKPIKLDGKTTRNGFELIEM